MKKTAVLIDGGFYKKRLENVELVRQNLEISPFLWNTANKSSKLNHFSITERLTEQTL